MLTDLLVFPIVLIVAVGLKYLLRLIGINNSIVYLSCLFLSLHLCLSGLLWLQLTSKDLVDARYISRFETATFAAVITTMIALITYIIIGLIPFLRIPFFFLRPLPASKYWSDLFIVAIPTFLSHVGSRMVAQSVMS
jgi:hypothetical protein